MGNSESSSAPTADSVVKQIPFVGTGYSAVEVLVHAVQGNEAKARQVAKEDLSAGFSRDSAALFGGVSFVNVFSLTRGLSAKSEYEHTQRELTFSDRAMSFEDAHAKGYF